MLSWKCMKELLFERMFILICDGCEGNRRKIFFLAFFIFQWKCENPVHVHNVFPLLITLLSACTMELCELYHDTIKWINDQRGWAFSARYRRWSKWKLKLCSPWFLHLALRCQNHTRLFHMNRWIHLWCVLLQSECDSTWILIKVSRYRYFFFILLDLVLPFEDIFQ